MKFFQKIKKSNGRRQIYICGVKIFSYKRKSKPCLDVGNNILEWNGKKVYNIPGLTVHFKGENAKVIIKGRNRFENSLIEVGNGCSVTMKESEYNIRLQVWLSDGSSLDIGKNFSSSGTQIHAGDGRNILIKIGDECICSWDVEIWASDGHTIFDCKTKKCLNIPKHVIIGDHVWLCKGAAVLKNTVVPEHCIVARNAVVVGASLACTHCVLAGTPAKCVKTGVDWDVRTVADYCEQEGQNDI